MMIYDPRNWFWIVGDDNSRAWSSAVGAYVSPAPQERVTRIASETELSHVLSSYGLRGPVVRVEQVAAERERRLSLGFAYDFGDGRGVHQIGTTPADMVGWNEVSTYAGALLDSGDTTTKIAVVTDTGPVEVTAPEWRAIEIAAAQFRQPIWSRSFVLMQTLPADYTADAHWA